MASKHLRTSLYKSRTSTQCSTTLQRIEIVENLRRNSRWTAVFQRRNITALMSPIDSPHKSAKKLDKVEVKKSKSDKRLEQLMKWKEQKRKRLEAVKANSKPVFKVSRVTAPIKQDLTDVYGKIKGLNTTKLVPSSTYKFKPPSNIKALNMKISEATQSNVRRKIDFKTECTSIHDIGSNKQTNDSSNNNLIPKHAHCSVTEGANLNHLTERKIKTVINSAKKCIGKLNDSNLVRGKEAHKKTSRSTRRSQLCTPKLNDSLAKTTLSCGKGVLTGNESPVQKNAVFENLLAPKIESFNVACEELKTSNEEALRKDQEIIEGDTNLSNKLTHSTLAKQSSANKLTGKETRKSRRKSLVNLSETAAIEQKETSNKPLSELIQTPFSTPSKVNNSTIYISPFVTIARGKDKSRKEFHERRSNICEDKNTSPKAAADFFENILEKEEERLIQLCRKWESYEESENPPEEAFDMIRMAVGQTNLLIKKKFSKFRELITQCRSSNPERVVTCLDLHGFWDIVVIQINNLNCRFANLDRLKTNNWEEILPVLAPKKQPKPKKNKVNKIEAKSRLRDLIQAQRKKNNVKECGKSPTIIVTTPRGKLLNISNTVEFATTPIDPKRTNTPKSILKSGSNKKIQSVRKTKTVLFANDEEKENVLHSSNLIEFSPGTPLHHYPRRSSRLAEKKIKF